MFPINIKAKIISALILVALICFSVPVLADPNNEQVTGIVIDVRDLSLERTMAPVILDENGRILNKLIPVNANWVAENGAVEYFDSDTFSEVSLGKSRVGDKYIMIKALGVKHYNRYPVISVNDAERILNIPGINDIFQQGKIVFIE